MFDAESVHQCQPLSCFSLMLPLVEKMVCLVELYPAGTTAFRDRVEVVFMGEEIRGVEAKGKNKQFNFFMGASNNR